MREVVGVLEQLFKALELRTSIADCHEIGLSDRRAGKLDDQFLVLQQNVAGLVRSQEQLHQLRVGDVYLLVVRKVNSPKILNELEKARNVFADERERRPMRHTCFCGEPL